MSNLKLNLEGNKVTLEGFIDEHSDLSELKALTGDVYIDFKGVSRINSCGVKEWVDTISTMDASLVYENCPLVIVKQLNAVPDFQGKAKVASFTAPYFCEECDEEFVQILKVDEINPDSPPTFKCEECSEEMGFDGVANQYFSFLKRAA